MIACEVQDLNLTLLNETISSVNGRSNPSHLMGLKFVQKNLNYIPKGIGQFFPHLSCLMMHYLEQSSIDKEDLRSTPHLIYLTLSFLSLETVESDLFEYNPKIQFLEIFSPNLKHVGEGLVEDLKDLKYFRIDSKVTKHQIADNAEKVSRLVKNLEEKCPPTAEMITKRLPKKVKILSKKVAELTAEVKSLTLSSISCDGNLNSATEKLLEMLKFSETFDQNENKILTTKQNLKMIVEVDDTKLKAVDFKVEDSGYEIKAVTDVNQTKVANNATELQIDHQQTLFLPTNLGSIFPNLKVLSVTSSGLFKIDASSFENMNQLSALNLTGNKLIEIQAKTFSAMPNLTTLDLSNNNIHVLEPDAFSGLMKLQNLNLKGNKIEFIATNLLQPLKELKVVDLSNNTCIDIRHPSVTLNEIEAKIKKNCVALINIECEIEQENEASGQICKTKDLKVGNPKTKILKLKDNFGSEAAIFYAGDQDVLYLPMQLGKFFPNLKTIFIERSKLTALRNQNFEDMKNLKMISITGNNISFIEEGAFDEVPQIEELNLSANNIQSLPTEIFASLLILQRLNLSNNQLKKITFDFISRKNVIQDLQVQKNQLELIDTKILGLLKAARLIDFTENSCINMKYAKVEGGSKSELYMEVDLNCSEDF